MAQHATRKNSTKAQTISRRAERAAKYTRATMTTNSGRARVQAKAAY